PMMGSTDRGNNSWGMKTIDQTMPRAAIRSFLYPEDLSGVLELWGNAGPGVHLGRSDTPEEIHKKLAHDPDLFLVAEQEGRLVGAVLGGFDGRRGMVYHLAVASEQRRQGLGEALMQAVEARLREKGCLRYYLLVTQDNESAMKFYEQRGHDRLPLHIYARDLT
ncbi:MAG TPA: GNAT family N-acetyltransferase, partial [Anaerolineales bacterium]|nr:GNAT family N-acetyltransferase [Anaerolineales bacterium]